ncbi:MAG: RecX family transcriptional regulator [Clostridiales bacterium]|jgi:regulatory protein|nr:RecX family transcriptional regulator [Clostridiales bacterium]
MPIITDIAIQQRNKKRVNISIDGSFVCGLESITVLKYNLQVGQDIEIEYLAELQLDSDKHTAFDKAVKYLSIRLRSELEMRQYLRDKGFLPLTIEYCIAKLCEYKYIDDEAFAKCYVESKSNKSGIRKLEYELRQLGVDQSTISECLAQVDAKEPLTKLVRKMYKGDRRKIIDYCLSRGFEYSDIKSVVEDCIVMDTFE